MHYKHRLKISEIDSFLPTFSQNLKGSEVIALIGDLGAGKTTFTQKLGKLLGVSKAITSPTYILLQEFKGQLINPKLKDKEVTIYHLDLYRTNSFAEAQSVGLAEFWGQPQTLTIIEWADKISEHLPEHTITIHLES